MNKKIQRLERAIERFENQLTKGTKRKRPEDPAVPLTEKDIKRIKETIKNTQEHIERIKAKKYA